jgi:SET domain-containing protein
MNEFIEFKPISLKKGKGAFAKVNIKKGTTVDIGHVILIPNKDFENIKDTIIFNYTFEWKDPNTKGEFTNAIAFDVCQFINHSYTPNITYYYDYEKMTIEFVAVREISRGEELTVNYNGKLNDNAPLWFDVE